MVCFRWWFALASLCAGGALRGQGHAPWTLHAAGQGGFIMAHTPTVRHLATSHPVGLRLDLSRRLSGRRAWHNLYPHATWGATAHYHHTGNARLGNLYALTLFGEPVVMGHRRPAGVRLTLRMGAGVGYAPRPFDLTDNPTNNALSASFNYALHGLWTLYVPLSRRLSLQGGAGLFHLSNGGSRKPNLGLNVVSAQLGATWTVAADPTFRPARPVDTLPVPVRRTSLRLRVATGRAQAGLREPRTYWLSTVGLGVGRRLNARSELIAELDGFRNPALRAAARTQGLTGRFVRLGVGAGHELGFGRMSLVTFLGGYLVNAHPRQGLFYQRWGLRYYAPRTPGWFGQLSMVTHLATADFVEWGVGMRW